MRRIAHKRPDTHRKQAGASRGRPKRKPLTTGNVRLAAQSGLDGDKKAEKKLKSNNDKRDRELRQLTYEWLAKKVPALEAAKNVLNEATYKKLLDQILEEIDTSYDDGYSDKPSGGGSNGGYNSRADMGDHIPAGSFIVTPYTGSGYADR